MHIFTSIERMAKRSLTNLPKLITMKNVIMSYNKHPSVGTEVMRAGG